MKNACDSCLMPFVKDPGRREHERYCSYCYRDGKLCYTGTDLVAFQRAAYTGMVTRGMNRWLATVYAWMIRFAPRWRQR